MNRVTPMESAERRVKVLAPRAAAVLNKWSGSILFFVLPLALILYPMSCFSIYRFSDVRFLMLFAQTRWITLIALTSLFYHLSAELCHIMMQVSQIDISENTSTVSTVLLTITALFACALGYWLW